DIIENFLDYAEREGILPEGMQRSEYRQRFLNSYPFQPEVIDVLYKRWGSFPSFQRTRGVLRLLALVVHSLMGKNVPFIRLSHFDLHNSDIREEFIKHIGREYDSVVSSDITSENSGAKKVDDDLGSPYRHYSYGTKVATTIFLYSFSGGIERGATQKEIKLSCAELGQSSTVIIEVIEKLRKQLFYLSDTGLFFTNQPNLNRIHLTKKENINPRDISKEEERLLNESFGKEHFKVYMMPSNSRDITDAKEFKLIVLKDATKKEELFEKCGDKTRVYRNTLIFLCPLESQRIFFEGFIKDKLAYKAILEDKTLNITEDKRKEVERKLKDLQSQDKYQIRSLYRLVYVPTKDGFREIDLGMPIHGEGRSIDKEIFEKLKSEEELLERLSPQSIEMKYLRNRDYVDIKNLLDSFYTTPGETRILRDDVLKEAIREGVKRGLFGVGRLQDGKPVCQYFKEEANISIEEGWIIIRGDLCSLSPKEDTAPIQTQEKPQTLQPLQSTIAQQAVVTAPEEKKVEGYKRIKLRMKVPMGNLSEVSNVLRFLQSKFNRLIINVEIYAEEGNISKTEYEDRIIEALSQSEIKIEEADLS
ncbi:MAG: AAA family ATPase, partial [Aquificaceae bacterium]